MSTTFSSVRKLATASPQVDTKQRMARCIITTDDVDREREVILPAGVDFTDYAKNPVVLWNHGLSGSSFPIGKCQRPDGSLAIEVGEHEIIGEVYFGRTKECDELFSLIKDGIVKAVSIHVQPIRKVKGPGGVSIIAESSMLEFSLGAIGMNKNARVLSAKTADVTIRRLETKLKQLANKLEQLPPALALRRIEAGLPILQRLIEKISKS